LDLQDKFRILKHIKKMKIVMGRDEYVMLITEFKEIVKGTKFEKLC